MSFITKNIEAGVAVITLNRPDKFNAFNREMALLLQSTLDDCDTDSEVRAVLLVGAGKAFSAGQDISELIGENAIGLEKILSEHYNPIILRIRRLQKPVVCAVNGVAAGAGANIALCCDIVVASNSASFIQAFSKIGLIPDSGGTFFLPRLIGFQKASALMMTGEKVSAEEAERLGMIFRVLPDENFAEASFTLAKQLADMPTRALYLTKMALNDSLHRNLDDQLHEEDILQQKAGGTQDYLEGIAAFLERENLFSLEDKKTPAEVVAHMMEHDRFSQWLGITVLEVAPGFSRIQMTVRDEMINGFGIVHGGIAFSLADSAFAFACNNRNVLSVALDTSINFTKPVHPGDVLIAEAKEMHNGRTTGLYHISISNQNAHVVAFFKGTCFRTGKPLIK